MFRLSPNGFVGLWGKPLLPSTEWNSWIGALFSSTKASCDLLRLPDTPPTSSWCRLKPEVAASPSEPHWVAASRLPGAQTLTVWAAVSWVWTVLQPHGLTGGLCSRLRQTGGLLISIIWPLEAVFRDSRTFVSSFRLAGGVGGLDWGSLGLRKAWSKWFEQQAWAM